MRTFLLLLCGFTVLVNGGACPSTTTYDSAYGAVTYLGGYDNSQNCQWLIDGEDGHEVRLMFISIDVEENPAGGCHDVVNIYDGASTNAPFTSYCGTNANYEVITTGKHALVQFISNADVTGNGFHIVFDSVERDAACTSQDLVQTGTSGSIEYPPGSSPYPNYANCLWRIEAGGPITLTFTDMDVEDFSAVLCYDVVRVYDGDSTAGPFTTFCGDTVPAPIISTGNVMLVQFISDYVGQYSGFELSWQADVLQVVMEPNPRCRESGYPDRSPGDIWVTTSDDGLRHKVCSCPFERPSGDELRLADICVGACFETSGTQTFSGDCGSSTHDFNGDSYYSSSEMWDYLEADGYTYSCTCSVNGHKSCDVKPGGHICEINGEVHQPGELDFIVEVGDVYSDRYEECDCPTVLPAGVNKWRRNIFCKGVCFDMDNSPHYEGDTYQDTLRKCFQYNCTCGDHGGRDCNMDVNGGHLCILGREKYSPGATWRRRRYSRNGVDYGYQECNCPLVWANPRSTYFNVHIHCRGICYEDATQIFYQDQSPYTKVDPVTGESKTCQCFNAGVEFCN